MSSEREDSLGLGGDNDEQMGEAQSAGAAPEGAMDASEGGSGLTKFRKRLTLLSAWSSGQRFKRLRRLTGLKRLVALEEAVSEAVHAKTVELSKLPPAARAGSEAELALLREQHAHLETKVELLYNQQHNTSKLLEAAKASEERALAAVGVCKEEAKGYASQLQELKEKHSSLEAAYAAQQQVLLATAADLDGYKAKDAANTGKLLASAMAKPPLFDGKGLLMRQKAGLQVDDWCSQVHRYCQGVGLSSSAEVAVAASHLRDDAARAWTAEEAVLLGSGQPITLSHVRQCLLKRFTPAATAHTARKELDALVLNGNDSTKGLAAYVTEFERLCALIPDLESGEKKHRFQSGIARRSVALARQCCTDPLTSAMYTDYVRMRETALHIASTSAEYLSTVEEAGRKLAQHASDGYQRFKRPRSGAGPAAAGPSAATMEAAGSPAAGSSRAAAGGGSGGAAGGSSSGYKRREDGVFQFCRQAGLCANCYGKFHGGKCSQPRAKGLPPGYTAPAK